jgi:ABC-type transporter Mla MlaB component
MSFLKEGQPDFAPGPAYTLANASGGVNEAGIEVQEAGGDLAPEMEEAAVLYANGKMGEAASQLNRFLLDHPENHDPLPWFMLFDLYEASNQPGPFDDAAVEFAVKFERSPPTWAPRGQVRTTTQPAPLISFGEKFGNIDRVKLQRYLQDGREAAFVRVDVSKASAPADEEGARALYDGFTAILGLGKPVEMIGAPGFAVRLSAAHQGGRLTESGWLVWLITLGLLGKEADFEDTAVEYAITFELSPPSYHPPLPLPTRGDVQSVGAACTQSAQVFNLVGVIGSGCEVQLAELTRFAESRTWVQINLAEVTRIDFAAVGLLLETVINLAQGQRKVEFVEGNEMVNALLKIVGASQFAAIHSRTRI